jgi:hypothetical protein
MSLKDQVVGTVGVALLLIAFFMNLFGMVTAESRTYQAMNVAGAGISCYASYLIGFVPFVVLEGVWCAAALAAMLRGRR